MANLYRSPLRVYLILALLSVIGVFSALKLPISLFPNSTKPEITACIASDLSPEAFLRNYGSMFEEQLRAINRGDLAVEKLTATYSPKDACFDISFKWGGDPQEAQREVGSTVNGLLGRLPEESRRQVNIWNSREDGGFLALSFYSPERSLTEVYKLIEPALGPKLARVSDAQNPEIYNPQKRQILIELKPEALAAVQLLPSDVGQAILRAIDAYGGGSLTLGTDTLRVEFPRMATGLDEFRAIQIPTASGRSASLGDVAHIDLTVPLDSARTFKTSGAASVLLWAGPKPGGNVKAMAEEIRQIVDETMPSLPKDIQYKVLVDPSEFIRSAVNNVSHEVALAAGLAVAILFLFVGNLRNVATAAIEIPLSIVLAFILMRLSGMNLNLISLGGLALSAGMNVDASVVVMENIFRHFEEAAAREPGRALGFEERMKIVVGAVREVQFAVIASTIASLVVFIPLVFTSDLSYAILGDLAKAVVFSHGFSAVVALILVPTIRLHLMKDGLTHEKPSFFEPVLVRLENGYARTLGLFLESRRARLSAYGALFVAFVVLTGVVAPGLPREIIGKPDTDWLILGVSASGNTLNRQMEAQTEEVESELLSKFGDHILYTFTQINRANNSFIMFRLKDKREMQDLWKKVEGSFTNTPFVSYWVDAWNPAELPIPNPPDFQVSVRGADREAMVVAARDFNNELRERKLFNRTQVDPNAAFQDSLRIRLRDGQLPLLAAQGLKFSLADLADLTRIATIGRTLTRVEMQGEDMGVFMRFPESYVTTPEELEALPIGAGSRIVPLKAVAQVSREEMRPSIRREDGRELYVIAARGERGEEKKTKQAVKDAEKLAEAWPKKNATLVVDDAQKDLNEALHQLAVAVSLSIALIFFTMVFQFGSLMNSLLVLVAIPLGLIGVILSLFVFRSTLSLNSMLGVILLNGLAVANSIILVDFLQRAVKEGVAPRLAAVRVAKVRLRPILMTSLCTGLGMLPVALGLGEGGKILQPLGIAVAGGLVFSMATTLFIVPALQVGWLEWRAKRDGMGKGSRTRAMDKDVADDVTTDSSTTVQATDEIMGETTDKASASTAVVVVIVGVLLAPNWALSQAIPTTATATTGRLTFAEAWTVILERDLRIQSQRLEVQASEARTLQALGAFTPSVTLNASSTERGEPFVGPVRSGAVSARLNLFRSGGDVAAYRAAKRDQEASRERLGSESQVAEREAAEALVAVIGRTQQKNILEKIVQLQADSLRVARDRYAKGLLPQQEVDKVGIELENARARLTDGETRLAEARASLATLLGRDDVRDEWPWKRVLVDGPGLETTVFDLGRRPDWRVSLLDTEAERLRKRSALASLFPSIDLTGSYGSADFSDSGRRDWSTVVTLSVPLFDGWTNYAKYRVQDTTLLLAEIRIESLRRSAAPEVEGLRKSHRAARESALARERTAQLSGKLFEDSFQRFRLGRASVNDLALDQSRLFESELLAVDGWSNAHLTFVRLCHALGGRVAPRGECDL